jgi:hypothetical protein
MVASSAIDGVPVMEKENGLTKKLAELKKKLEASGQKVTNIADKVKAIGFVGGIGAHQKRNQPSPERDDKETGTAPDSK